MQLGSVRRGPSSPQGLRKVSALRSGRPNIYQWIIAAIGAQSIGGVLVPLNTRYKGSEGAYIIRSSGAKMLFTVGDFLGMRYPEMLADQPLPETRTHGAVQW